MFIPSWVIFTVLLLSFGLMNEWFRKALNWTFIGVFVLANSPLIASYWLAKNVMKLDMDH